MPSACLRKSAHPNPRSHPVSLQITFTDDGIIRRHSSSITDQSVLEACQRTETAANFTSLRWMISDLREVTIVEVSDEVLDHLIAQVIGASFVNNQINVAIVATHQAVIAIAQRFMQEVPQFPMRLFGNLEEAEAWVKQ